MAMGIALGVTAARQFKFGSWAIAGLAGLATHYFLLNYLIYRYCDLSLVYATYVYLTNYTGIIKKIIGIQVQQLP